MHENTRENVIFVRMLGDFSITYMGERITLERNSGTKAMQLLQYLIYHGREGATRERLTEILYSGDDDVVNPHNNLKVNIFRLRKLLDVSGLPQCDYIVYQNGRYSWRSDVEVRIDAQVFEKAAQRAMDFRLSPAEHRQLLSEAAALYTGEFLPMLAAEPWAALEIVRYKNIFLTVAEEMVNLLNAQGRFEESYAISGRAVTLSQYEEKLHLMRINSLLDLRRYPDALQAYDEAAKLFLENLGIAPSREMKDVYHRITGTVRNTTSLIEEVRESLRKDQISGGAYYCNYPGFIDSYLYVSRLVERNGQSIYLMLSTLTDVHGIPLELRERLSNAAECLHNALFATLRGSDLFTRYSPCQFLILLTGINRESCVLVANRVSEKFREVLAETGIRGVRVRHTFASGLVVDETDRELKFSDNPWNEQTEE
jgi:DNA-binding SARP family transcriptional activator